ncbi:MAG: hypothetical protein HRF49_01435 [bacterium]
MIDLIASEYGWTAAEILDAQTMRGLEILAAHIRARKAEERVVHAVAFGADRKEAERAIKRIREKLIEEICGKNEEPKFDPAFFSA